MITTVGQLVDATYRQYLEPPDYQPPIAVLRQPMDETTDELKIGTFAVAEDEQLLRVGVLCEVDSELVRVIAYNDVNDVATVRRGELGTSSVGHATLAPVKISPPYPRIDVLRAVSSALTTLAPPLFSVKVMQLAESSTGVAVLPDPLAVSIIDITRADRAMLPVGSFDLVDHHPQTGTRSVLVPSGIGDFWVRYRRRLGVPTSEADLLEDLGMEAMWAPAVIAGAAAEMMVGRDVSRTTVEWVGQVLESQAVEVGTRAQLGISLYQYRNLLVEEYKAEQTQEHRSVTLVRKSPWVHSAGGVI